MSGGADYRGKRLFDLAVLVLTSPVTVPVSAVCAVAVALDDGRPVLFTQERIGRHGRPFRIFKFRTMHRGDNPLVPTPDRITRSGRILRRLSLDELPQLVNVALGDMSVVGPRPTLAYQVERYTPRQRRRLLVRPGLTGLAQVRGRNSLSWGERIEFDLDYLDAPSMAADLAILLQSVRVALSGEGVEGHDGADPLVAVPGHSEA